MGCLLAGLFCIIMAAPALADVSARLDRYRAYEGDPVTLTIESDTKTSAEPDLAPLSQDFRVVGTSTSSQVSIINGQRSSRTSWIVQLEPRRLGTLRIPAISIGKEHSQPLELEVTEIPEQLVAEQSEHLFIEVETDYGRTVFVQQQIPYTVRFYFDDLVLNGDLSEPQPEHAVVEKLGEDKRYTATRNDRNYNVIERNYVISPEKSGPLHIPPVTFNGQLAATGKQSGYRTRRNRLIDRFFSNSPFSNDPFFGLSPFAGPGKTVRVHSKPMTIDIQPRPAAAGSQWLPAEQLTLQDSWAEQPPQFRAGEPVSRTITLHAKGLTGAQIPALQLAAPEHTRLYPEAPVNESRTDGTSVYGISKQTITYIPGVAGKLTIPAIELDWWNTNTNQSATARLTQWEVNVEAGSGDTQPSVIEETRNDERELTEAAGHSDLTPPATRRSGVIASLMPWLAAAAGALILLGFARLAINRSLRNRQATETTAPDAETEQSRQTAIEQLVPELERACSNNDAQAAARVLLELGQARWPEFPPRSLGMLAARLGQGNEEISRLDRQLYAADNSAWEGSGLWHAINNAWRIAPAGEKSVQEELKPLYPHST